MAMSQLREEKLKPLLNDVPPGFLVDAAWLTARRIDRKSIYNYVERGWLEHVVRGVYRRPFLEGEQASTKAGWKIPVLSMQRLMGFAVHVGGRTALGVQGFSHYVELGDEETVYLYGDAPSWLKRLPDADRYETRTLSLFGGETVGIDDHEATLADDDRSTPWRWPMSVSSSERAIFELLNELPDKESFHIADSVFEGLSNLRPRLIEALLHACRSIKVKRLFFVFADRHDHAWRKHINRDDFDLGSGPRALVDGGKIHPDYNISVPPEYLPVMEGHADGP